MEEVLADERFKRILTDHRFRKIPRNVQRVAVDKRFKEMFKDKKFKRKCMLDKRGRPLDLTSSEDLKKFYDVSSESSEDDDEESENEKNKCETIQLDKKGEKKKPSIKSRKQSLMSKMHEKSSESDSDELSEDENVKNVVKGISKQHSSNKQKLSEDYKEESEKEKNRNNKHETIQSDKKGKKKKQPIMSRKQSLLMSKKQEESSEGDSDEELSKEKINIKDAIKGISKKYSSKKPRASSENDDSDEINIYELSDDMNNKSPVKQQKNMFSKGITSVKNRKGKLNVEKRSLLISEKKESSEDNSDEELSEEVINVKNAVKEMTEKHMLQKQEESTSENDDSNELSENTTNKSKVKTHFKVKDQKNKSSKRVTSVENDHSKKEFDSVLSKESEDETCSSDENADKDSSDESDDSDDSESDDSSGDKKGDFDHRWEELRNEAPDTDEISRRIAVCNMDWDRIRAEDLFSCFNSFKPADGCINSVKIYPSEYGLKRMEGEKIHGPSELVEEKLPLDAEESEEDTKGSRYHREKLRQYQINRLKYYYAVIDCDSPETANTVYEQLNGMEYESSSVRFDLRFIPDDVTFDHEPMSVADKVPEAAEYKPRLFVTSALQQVKVNLTWDETDPKRRETLQKAFTEPDSIEKDIKDYLASSSDDSEEEETEQPDKEADKKLKHKDRIAMYKELLLSLEEEKKQKENEFEMEITWEPGLKEKTNEMVKEKMKTVSLTPFEEMLHKQKEERKSKKKEKSMQKQNEDDSSASDSSDEFFSKRDSREKDQDARKLAELALISDSKKAINFEEKAVKEKKEAKTQKIGDDSSSDSNEQFFSKNISASKEKGQDSRKKAALGSKLDLKETNFEERTNKKKKKVKTQKMDNFKLDVNDSRFSAIYTSHLFNIDPSDPHYKDTEGNRALIHEKQRKFKSTDFNEGTNYSKRARYS